MSFLDNLRVSAKVGVNSGILIVFLLVASGMAVLGLSNANQAVDEYRRLARQSNAASDIVADLLAARVGVQVFMRTGNQDAAETVRREAVKADKAAAAALELFNNPARRAQVEDVKRDFERYLANFEVIVTMRARRDQLVTTLNEVGPQAERLMTAVMEGERAGGNAGGVYQAAQAEVHLLLARLSANRFLLSNGDAEARRVADEIAATRAALQTLASSAVSDAARQSIQPLAKLLEQYETAFGDVAKLVVDRNRIVREQLDTLGPKMAASLYSLRTQSQDRQDVLGPQTSAAIDQALWVGVVVAVVALVLGVISAVLIGRGISGPIAAMTAAMGRLANGDKAVEIPARGRRDEVGQMASAVQVFKDNMIRAEQLAAEQETERAAREARARRIEDLTRGFDQAVASVLTQFASSTDELQATASSMSATAEETNRQASAVAAASEQASANVQAVASASEELSGSIEEIGRQVTQSARIANQASQDAEATNAQVQTLAEAARKVGEVVNLIQDIAAQTNLLALNATIEAARAGEMGKGFAVVAGEVKSLAAQTARATEEIGQHIGGIQTATGDAVSAIQGIGTTISEINEIAGSIASAVEEQGAATREISRNVQEAAKGTHEVSRNITGVTQAASDTGTAAEQVNASAGQLSAESGTLRRTVEEFLAGVRSA